MTSTLFLLTLLFLSILLLQVFGSLTPSLSASTSYESCDSLASLNNLNNQDQVQVYKTLFSCYMTEFDLFENVDFDSSSKIFTQVMNLLLGRAANLNEIIFDPQISLKVHCLLLDFFMKHFDAADHSSLLKDYTAALYKRTDLFKIASPEVIHKFVFPTLRSLVNTGNFFNYSMLFPVLMNHFTEDLGAGFYQIHIRQYFLKKGRESALEFEVFKFGLEFLSLYFPRYEIYSISNLENVREIAVQKPFAYYLILLHPLRAAANVNAPLTRDVLSKIEMAASEFPMESELFLKLLEAELRICDFLNCNNDEDYNMKRIVFNAIFEDFNGFTLIRLNLTITFMSWLCFKSPILDPESFENLRNACIRSKNPEFIRIFEEIYE